jgi:hypothetical protein
MVNAESFAPSDDPEQKEKRDDKKTGPDCVREGKRQLPAFNAF